MPDITMCTKESCKKAMECYRKQAIPNDPWQSYSNFDECCAYNNWESFIPIKE